MKSIILIALIGIFTFACQEATNISQEEPSPFHDGINWQGDNEIANYLAIEGIGHWENIELEKAYVLYEKAVELDSSLFASHTALALLSSGEKKDYHKEMANKFVADENEASKLFVSLLDIENDSTAAEKRREVWTKMHKLSNGPFIHFRYALSRSDTLEAIEELDKLESFLDEIEWNTAHLHNVKGYVLQSLGNLDQGITEIEKYMVLYPDGYNPLDSRAEFYLFAGDTAKAIEYYEKTVERFPYATSAGNALNNLSKD